MEVYSTEEQQAEAIKRFFRENGTSLIAGVVIGLGGLYGWKTYNQSQIESAEAASDAYTQFIKTAGQENSEILAKSDEFLTNQQGSNYAVLASFVAAREAVDAKKFDVAVDKLNWVVSNSANVELKAVAITRIARIQLEQKQFDQALQTLAAQLPASYEANVAELKGDIHLAKGDTAQALSFYQEAVDAKGLENNPQLQIKLDDLAVVSAVN